MVHVSVVIRSKNEERLLGRTLESLERQSFQDFEVVLVDSGSTDTTLDIAKKFTRVRIVEIPSQSFTFGYALNVGAQAAKGTVIVNLSAHAIPVHNTYLGAYLDHFADPLVAGVYGRQVPLAEHHHLRPLLLSPGDYDKCYGPEKTNRPGEYFFSNSNAAILKARWEEYPFNESMTGAEDWEWAKRVHAGGYRTLYEPRTIVYHSHNETLRQIWQRARREAVGFKQLDAEWYRRTFFSLSWLCFTGTCGRVISRDVLYSISHLKRWDVAFYAIPYRFFQLLGYYQGFANRGRSE